MCILSFTEERTIVKAEWRQKDRGESESERDRVNTELQKYLFEHATAVKVEYRNKRDRRAKKQTTNTKPRQILLNSVRKKHLFNCATSKLHLCF